MKNAGSSREEIAPDPMCCLGCRNGIHLFIWSDKLKQGDIVPCAYCRVRFEFRMGRFRALEVKE
jgi:hypothetical protein